MKTRSTHNHSRDDETASHEAIQKRAYELFVARGQEPGHELEDWLQAENEARGKLSQTVESRGS